MPRFVHFTPNFVNRVVFLIYSQTFSRVATINIKFNLDGGRVPPREDRAGRVEKVQDTVDRQDQAEPGGGEPRHTHTGRSHSIHTTEVRKGELEGLKDK